MEMSARDRLFRILESADQNDKVVDVSKITVDGKGARMVSIPKTDRSSKKQIEGLNIISDNYESYKLATDILGPQEKIFADAYLYNFGDLKHQMRARSPSRTRSPTRSQSPPRNHIVRSQSPSRNQVVRSRSPQRFDIRSNVRNY